MLGCPLGAPSYASVRPQRAPTTEVQPGSGVWPLEPRPRVVRGFDPPATRYGSGHRGVDLAGHPGQGVHAALAGRVSYAGRLAGRGVVVVDHGGTRTTYEPVLATVHVGDRVATGGRLGLLSLVGSHCFPAWCLHWGLIAGRDTYLDPLTLVGAVPVVLLPSSGGVAPLLRRPSRSGPSTLGRPSRAPASMRVTPGLRDATGRSPTGATDEPGQVHALLAPEMSRPQGRIVVWPVA